METRSGGRGADQIGLAPLHIHGRELRDAAGSTCLRVQRRLSASDQREERPRPGTEKVGKENKTANERTAEWAGAVSGWTGIITQGKVGRIIYAPMAHLTRRTSRVRRFLRRVKDNAPTYLPHHHPRLARAAAVHAARQEPTARARQNSLRAGHRRQRPDHALDREIEFLQLHASRRQHKSTDGMQSFTAAITPSPGTSLYPRARRATTSVSRCWWEKCRASPSHVSSAHWRSRGRAAQTHAPTLVARTASGPGGEDEDKGSWGDWFGCRTRADACGCSFRPKIVRSKNQ